MILIKFEKDYELGLMKVNSWQYITPQMAMKVKLTDLQGKFNDSDIPLNFYKYPTEFVLDSNNKLRRYYVKKKAV